MAGTKLKFEAILEGRGSGAKPPRVSPDGCIIVGVDGNNTELIRAHGGEEGAKALRAYERWYSNPEVAALLADPKGFFASGKWPEDVRSRVEQMMAGILTVGSNVTPVTLRDFEGDDGRRYAVVCDGRHTVACVRVLRRVLAGEVSTGTPVDALARELRAKRGADWKPDLYAVDGVISEETGEGMDYVELAAVKQVLRVPTRRERWGMVEPRFKSATAKGEKPDFRAVAATAGVSPAEAKAWWTIYGMDKAVVAAFLDGAVPATSVVQFASREKAEQVAAVTAMIEAGDTSVSAAKSMARASRRADEPAALETADEADLDAPEEIPAEEPVEGAKTAAKPKKPASVDPAAKPWTARKLYDHAVSLGDHCPPELMAAARLVYQGTGQMTKAELRSIKVKLG